MFFSDKEKRIMKNLFLAISENINRTYVLTFFDGDVAEVRVETCYETDNGLEEDAPDFEEYNACAMKIVKIIVNKNRVLEEGKLIEINYHNYPQQIRDSDGNII